MLDPRPSADRALARVRAARRRRGAPREKAESDDGTESERTAHYVVALASATCSSRASSTFVTCWFTIGWKTR